MVTKDTETEQVERFASETEGVEFGDIIELTEAFDKNVCKTPLDFNEIQDYALETILKEQLKTIKYNIKMRGLIVSKLVPLLSKREKISPRIKQDIVALQNLFEVVRKNNQETNNTQKVVNFVLNSMNTNAGNANAVDALSEASTNDVSTN